MVQQVLGFSSEPAQPQGQICYNILAKFAPGLAHCIIHKYSEGYYVFGGSMVS